MGQNGRWIGTPRWVKEFGRWVRRIPERHLKWLRERGKVPVDNDLPRDAGNEHDGPPGVARPRMSRTRPARDQR